MLQGNQGLHCTSTDNANWVELFNGTFDDPQLYGQCDEPLETVRVDNLTYRYIRFTAVNYYRNGAGLQYLGLDFVESESCHNMFSILLYFGYMAVIFLDLWSDWSAWGACSSVCGGTQNRTRTCLTSGCTGESTQIRNCLDDQALCCSKWE